VPQPWMNLSYLRFDLDFAGGIAGVPGRLLLVLARASFTLGRAQPCRAPALQRGVAFRLKRRSALRAFVSAFSGLADSSDCPAVGGTRRSRPSAVRPAPDRRPWRETSAVPPLLGLGGGLTCRSRRFGFLKPAISFDLVCPAAEIGKAQVHPMPFNARANQPLLPRWGCLSPRFAKTPLFPSAQERDDIGADVILAQELKGLVRRRHAIMGESADSLLPCRHAILIVRAVKTSMEFDAPISM